MDFVVRYVLAAILGFAGTVGSTLGVAGPVAMPSPAAFTAHSPILLVGNGDFDAAHGVTGGSGSASDPYRIEGWEIDASSANGIEVRNTDAFFVIRNVYVHSGAASFHIGIVLSAVSNGRLENLTITNNSAGIFLDTVRYVAVVNSTVSLGPGAGVIARSSQELRLTRTVISGNRDIALGVTDAIGFVVEDSNITSPAYPPLVYLGNVSDSVLTRNRISGSLLEGLFVSISRNLTLSANNFTGNAHGVRLERVTAASLSGNVFGDGGLSIEGDQVAHFDSHTISTDNAVNGLPLRYLHDCRTVRLDNVPTGQIIVANCDDVRVSNLTIQNTTTGIQVAFSRNIALTNIHVTDVRLNGTVIRDSRQVEVQGLDVTRSGILGIDIWRTTGLDVRSSRFADMPYGVTLGDVSNATISGNNVSHAGLGLSAGTSFNVTVRGNEFADNGVGLGLSGPQGILVYANRILRNSVQATDFGVANSWDAGYPAGGNYWLDYGGADNCSGPRQDICPDPDGIGDTPYVIDADSKDRYPRITPNVAHVPVTRAILGQPILIVANVTDTLGVSQVVLFFRTQAGAGFQSIAMTRTSGDTYRAELPGLTSPGTLDYYIQAADVEGYVSRVPGGTGWYTIKVVRPAELPSGLSPLALGGVFVAAGAGLAAALYLAVSGLRSRSKLPRRRP